MGCAVLGNFGDGSPPKTPSSCWSDSHRALENVDSSSGAIGSAVNQAIDALVEIVASAPADPKTRDRWLERLWEAYQADRIPYIEALGDHWVNSADRRQCR